MSGNFSKYSDVNNHTSIIKPTKDMVQHHWGCGQASPAGHNKDHWAAFLLGFSNDFEHEEGMIGL